MVVMTKKPSKKKSSRKGVPLNIWLPEDLRAAIDEQVQESRRPLTTEVIIALEEYLSKHGKWPRTAIQ